VDKGEVVGRWRNSGRV